MKLSPDLREFVALCLSERVEFILVGAHALAFHGAPRFTEDIDLFVLCAASNAERLLAVVEKFGFGDLGLTLADFLVEDQVIQLGRAPNRIDLLTGISGVTWEEVRSSQVEVELDGLVCHAIGKEALIANKRATGRIQDLADVERLTRG